MLARVSSRELSEWWCEYRLDPWGEERADLRAAVIAREIANRLRGKKGRKAKLDDFMPKFGPPKTEAATPEQLKMKFLRMNAQLGGTVVKKPT